MIDDRLEWLAVAFDDDEPTIPDALGDGWPHLVGFDADETRRSAALTGDDEPPEAEWELELEDELVTRRAPRLHAS